MESKFYYVVSEILLTPFGILRIYYLFRKGRCENSFLSSKHSKLGEIHKLVELILVRTRSQFRKKPQTCLAQHVGSKYINKEFTPRWSDLLKSEQRLD